MRLPIFLILLTVLSPGCGSEARQASQLDAVRFAATLSVAIGSVTADSDTHTILIAAAPEITKLWYCEGNVPDACDSGVGKQTNFLTDKDGRRFFSSQEGIALKDKMHLTFVGTPASGASLVGVIRFDIKVVDSSGNSGVTSSTDYDWNKEMEWTDVPTSNWNGDSHGSIYFTDVMTHTKDRWMQAGPSINAHETMHGLLNSMNKITPTKDQFVYHEKGKGAYVAEPAMHASKIKEYLPAEAKKIAANRMKLYLENQVAAYFPNVLYQFDEWNAYVTNSRVALEMFEAGKWKDGGTDEVDGAMDFLYFGSAAVLALTKREPEYIKTNKQFKAAYAMLAEKSMYFVTKGLAAAPFAGFHAKKLQDHFTQSPENQAIRDALKQIYGPVWTKRVFGF
jgi:hypothetical protein